MKEEIKPDVQHILDIWKLCDQLKANERQIGHTIQQLIMYYTHQDENILDKVEQFIIGEYTAKNRMN